VQALEISKNKSHTMDLLDQMLAEAEADFNVNEHDELDKVWHILN